MKEEAGHKAADYEVRDVEAARRVMTELGQVLADYREGFVLIGGWVPDLLLPDADERHIGSLDVDLLLNPKALAPGRYAALLDLLEGRGYHPTDKPFRYAKEIEIEGGPPVRVDVDFLIPEGAKTDKVEAKPGFRAIDMEAGWLALGASQVLSFDGTMPEGAPNRIRLSVVSVEAYVILKALALDRRGKEKDAYDLVYSLRNWPGESAAIAQRLMPYIEDKVVQEGLAVLRDKFRFAEDLGPQWVSRFLDSADQDERAFHAQDAFQRVDALLKAIEASKNSTP